MRKEIKIPVFALSSTADAKALWSAMEKRRNGNPRILKAVQAIVDEVQSRGDSALYKYAKKFDGVTVTARSIRINPAEFSSRAKKISPAVGTAIVQAAKRIQKYHEQQKLPAFSIKTAEGTLSQVIRPLERVGVYVPGGYTIYPSTVLMDVIPALIAGVREIAVVTPARGGLDPGLAFAFKLLGITEAYRIGGAQAIAALAYGTKSIRAVDKIVGPGSVYVSCAKKLVYGAVDIDMVAGPSEVAIIADDSADPRWVALDLLSQAEHGTGDEMAICVTEQQSFAEKVAACLKEEIQKSPVRNIFNSLMPNAISLCVTKNRKDSIRLVNQIAPEHLQIMTRTARKDLDAINNAGAVFLGNYSPVPLGDYYVGTNHVLPTGRAARYASPLGVPSFLKRISVAEVTKQGIAQCARNVAAFARAERFEHHAMSVEARLR